MSSLNSLSAVVTSIKSCKWRTIVLMRDWTETIPTSSSHELKWLNRDDNGDQQVSFSSSPRSHFRLSIFTEYWPRYTWTERSLRSLIAHTIFGTSDMLNVQRQIHLSDRIILQDVGEPLSVTKLASSSSNMSKLQMLSFVSHCQNCWSSYADWSNRRSFLGHSTFPHWLWRQVRWSVREQRWVGICSQFQSLARNWQHCAIVPSHTVNANNELLGKMLLAHHRLVVDNEILARNNPDQLGAHF